MLTSDQKAAIEKETTGYIAQLLANMPNAGPDAPVAGICAKHPRKDDVEDWLEKKSKSEDSQEKWTLRWAAIAAIVALVGVALTAYTIWK